MGEANIHVKDNSWEEAKKLALYFDVGEKKEFSCFFTAV